VGHFSPAAVAVNGRAKDWLLSLLHFQQFVLEFQGVIP
jgi:hypothetical protein